MKVSVQEIEPFHEFKKADTKQYPMSKPSLIINLDADTELYTEQDKAGHKNPNQNAQLGNALIQQCKDIDVDSVAKD